MTHDDRYEPQGYEPNERQDYSHIHIDTCRGCDFPPQECRCAKQVTRCFTFGFGHSHPNGFVRITRPTYEQCREEMARRYGNKWAFDYSEEQIADQMKRFPQMYEVIE